MNEEDLDTKVDILMRRIKTRRMKRLGHTPAVLTKDDIIEDLQLEWIEANDESGCNCPAGHPPCSFCTDGYSVTMEEFVENRLAEEYGITPDQPNTTHDDYDRAMKDLF